MPDLNAEIDELLAKLLAGEASTEETSEVEDWLDDSAANRRYFADLKSIWQHAGAVQITPAYPIDTEAALLKIKAKLHTSAHQPARKLPLWTVAAAAAFAGLLIACFLLLTPKPYPAQQFAAAETVRTETLRDGSVIALNRHSELSVAPDFGRRERRMKLRGEAHFSVAPDVKKPFIIEVGQLEVRVVGTEFTVDDMSAPGTTTVTVKSGTVALRAGNETLQVTAGQEANYDSGTGRLSLSDKQNLNADAWRSLDFRFESTPLAEVVRILEDAYGIQITLKNDQLARCPLTGHYAGEKPERVLELIADTFSLTLTREGDVFVLDGAACVE